MNSTILPFEIKFSNQSAGLIEGYGSVFGNIDSHGDVIEPGAFKASLTAWKEGGQGLPAMYMQHGAAMGADPRPVGIWTEMSEDSRGLKVAGKLVGLDTDTGRYNLALIAEGAIRGLSIGYRVPTGGARSGDRSKGIARHLTNIDLREVSLVTDPSNGLARVSSLKAADRVASITDFEGLLKDAGFSRAAARKLAAGGWPALKNLSEDPVAALRQHINQVAITLKG